MHRTEGSPWRAIIPMAARGCKEIRRGRLVEGRLVLSRTTSRLTEQVTCDRRLQRQSRFHNRRGAGRAGVGLGAKSFRSRRSRAKVVLADRRRCRGPKRLPSALDHCASKFAVRGLTAALRGALDQIQHRRLMFFLHQHQHQHRGGDTWRTVHSAGMDRSGARLARQQSAGTKFHALPYPATPCCAASRFRRVPGHCRQRSVRPRCGGRACARKRCSRACSRHGSRHVARRQCVWHSICLYEGESFHTYTEVPFE